MIQAAHRAGLKVMANLEAVNPWHWPAGRTRWNEQILKGVITDLHNCGVDRWFDEVFPCYSDFALALAKQAKKIGIEYHSGADPQVLYSRTQFQSPGNFDQIYRNFDVIGMYHYYFDRDHAYDTASLAQQGSVAYGFARHWGKPAALIYSISNDWGTPPRHWQGVLRACCLIRAIQFRIDDIMIIGMDRTRAEQLNVKATKTWVSRYVEKQRKRPLMNLVVHLPESGPESCWQDMAASSDAITSAAFHGGYDVVCSSEPVADANAYYVYTAGSSEQGTIDLTGEIAELFEGDKPVFLQCGRRVPSGNTLTANWKTVLARCGLDTNKIIGYGTLAAEGIYDNNRYNNKRFKYTGCWTKGTGEFRPDGAVIQTLSVKGHIYSRSGRSPLIIGQNKKYLIAANCINYQCCWPIGDILAGCGTSAESNVWGIAGRDVTALLAIANTRLELTIPGLPKGSKIDVTIWDGKGDKKYESSAVYAAPYTRTLAKYDLIVIETR